MERSNPPSAATWLLRHFGSSPNNDSVIGDLVEQFSQRPSTVWYWRQAIVAIAVSLCRELWSHKLLAVRALIVGWTVSLLLSFLALRPLGYILIEELHPNAVWTYYLFTRVLDQSWWSYYRLAYPLALLVILEIVWCISVWVSGYAVSRSSRKHYKPLVVLYAVSVLIRIAVSAMSAVENRLDVFVTVDSAVYLGITTLANVAAVVCLLWGGKIFSAPSSVPSEYR